MKQKTQNSVLFGVLVLAAGALWLYATQGIQKPEARRAQKKADEEMLLNLPSRHPSDAGALRFRSMTLQARGETTVLEHGMGGWTITSPVKAKADAFTVDAIATQIQTARLRGVVEENPSDADLERYGLKHPHFTVRATLSTSDAPRELLYEGGVENPFDGSVYLRKANDLRVYSAEGGLRWTFEKSTFDLRDKEHFRFDESLVEKLQVKASEPGGYRLEKDASKAWKLTAPVAADADPGAVNAMMAVLRAERALAFVDDPKTVGNWEAPWVDIQLTFPGNASEGPTAPLRFRFLKRAEEGTEKIYALREQGKDASVAQVSQKALQALHRPAFELKDKTVLRIQRENIARIIFKPAGNGENALIVERAMRDGGAEQWTIVAPRPGPAQTLKIAAALWMLEGIKATRSGEEAPKQWSQYGISAQSKTVELANHNGQVLARLQMGKAVPDKPNLVYVRGTRNQVLEVDAAKLAELPSELDDVAAGAPMPQHVESNER